MPIIDPFKITIGGAEVECKPLTRAQELSLSPHLLNARRRTPEDMEFIAGIIAPNVGLTGTQLLEHDDPAAFWVVWNTLWARSRLTEVARKNLNSSSSALTPGSTGGTATADGAKSTENGASSGAKA